jgi:DNA-binding transcriptional regulator YiaG
MKETLNSRVAVVETKVEAISSKLDEVRDEIKEVHACLHKTRELILSEIKALRQEENAQHEQFNKRVAVLENWRWYLIGIACAVGFAFKYIIA